MTENGFDKCGAGGSSDPMAAVEKAKDNDAKTRAEELLKCLKEGVLHKRPVQDEFDHAGPSGESSAKRQKSAELESDEILNLDAFARIQLHKVQTIETCLHEVAVPHNAEYVPLTVSHNVPAKTFPFVLDPFQKESILCLDNHQSVLVSAHTSAGKTVVALYAVAMSLNVRQRVIYTTPIKALSNQKFRELSEEFHNDVGLMTGDVTINPNASCLVMTTEILRSMLYRGSEIMREVGWVIFDEIHYMRDKERGVVWEETIILLPDEVRYVFLSATIPNASQFAEWICFLHNQPCHVVYTDYRPVPLRHYIYPAGGEGIYIVVNEKGEFRNESFNKAMGVLQQAGDAGQGDKRGRKGGFTSGDGTNVFKIVDMAMQMGLSPVIIFSFSRRECEAYAMDMATLDLTTDSEKSDIQDVFDAALEVLSDEDKQLPQIAKFLPILKRGVGIHHSGLLPILKETIEILFGEGYLKALFATETFAMGLNMPAKTVLFTSARKFDGKDMRFISSGEYIQMSGRAGRRGKDEQGTVILIVDQQLGSDTVSQIVKGKPDSLNSQFRLTYNMVLNLLRVEGINPEFMLERSFFQFQNFSLLPGLQAKMDEAKKRWESINLIKESEATGYYNIKREIKALDRQLNEIITKPVNIVPFLQAGRLIHVKHGSDDFGWGMVIDYERKIDKNDPINTEPVYIVNALMYVSKDSVAQAKNPSSSSLAPKPCQADQDGLMEVVPVILPTIHRVSSVRVYFDKDLRLPNHRQSVYKSIEEVKKRFNNILPLLDPLEDMKIKDSSLKDLVEKIKTFEERFNNHPLKKDPQLEKICKLYEEKLEAEEQKKLAHQELKKAHSLLQLDELKRRKRVLRRLGYADAQDVITLKGRVACEISAADELLLTEMLFAGAFNELTTQQAVALLSCFVFQEKAETPQLADELSGLLRQMQEIAKHIAKVTAECKLPIDEEVYVQSFKPHLMDVVHAWCSGAAFSDLLCMTKVFEGSIIRCMRRLEELLREMSGAARAMGNADLENKFSDGIRRIKRDIIFAASLYLG